MAVIGIIHPGSMGAGLGGQLRAAGHEVLWLPEGRSPEPVARADAARLTAVSSLAALCERCDVLLSICPPHAAVEVAEELAGFGGVYVDANAIAPETAGRVAETVTG